MSLRDLDMDEYPPLSREEEDQIALMTMPNEGAWHPSVCPTCGGPCESRVVGLRSVAEMGDETMAGTERRPAGIDPNSESALLAALATLRSRKP